VVVVVVLSLILDGGGVDGDVAEETVVAGREFE